MHLNFPKQNYIKFFSDVTGRTLKDDIFTIFVLPNHMEYAKSDSCFFSTI